MLIASKKGLIGRVRGGDMIFSPDFRILILNCLVNLRFLPPEGLEIAGGL